MASKNSIKIYREESFYHLYNRGVDRRTIFVDAQDYVVFLSYLKTYLTPKDRQRLHATIFSPTASAKEKDKALKELRMNNYTNEVDLVCYALMPNHFHLLIRQSASVINSFMNSLGTRYGMYFNRKYKRIGSLFQDVYKAVLIETDEQLLHLSRYIHLNPIRYAGISVDEWELVTLPFSLPEYLNLRQTVWVKPQYILDYFSRNNPRFSYKEFLGASHTEDIVTSVAIDAEDE